MIRRGWIAAVALVVATNALVLVAVAWNRFGDPQATLELTERELPMSYRVVSADDNTGMALRLRLHADSYTPDWLGEEKLRELGFAVPQVVDQRNERWKQPLPRPAWVVLEFEGPGWAALIREKERQLERARAGDGTVDPLGQPVGNLEKDLRTARQNASRLVAVDAGQDALALRARYPDRSRYVVVGAEVRIEAGRFAPDADDAPWIVRGRLRPHVGHVHVPLPHARTLQTIVDSGPRQAEAWEPDWAARYRVRLNYGNRHEPWVDDVGSIGGPAD